MSTGQNATKLTGLSCNHPVIISTCVSRKGATINTMKIFNDWKMEKSTTLQLLFVFEGHVLPYLWSHLPIQIN
jgi:hypothetical protein